MKLISISLLCLTLAGPAAAAPAAGARPATAYGTGEFIDHNRRAVGHLRLIETPSGVLVEADVSGLTPGEHGFHLHQTGRCNPADGFKSAGEHLAAAGAQHGFQQGEEPHAGDMPNQVAGTDGWLFARVLNPRVTLRPGEARSLFDADGSAVVIHAKPDDYQSQPSGSAGDRVACAVVRTSSAKTSAELPKAMPRADLADQVGLTPGMAVFDRLGQRVGYFQTLARSALGSMAVLQIDGKAVSVPRHTLRVSRDRVLSDQSKSEILAAADVPR